MFITFTSIWIGLLGVRTTRAKILARDGRAERPAHQGWGTRFQVRPPSLVSKFLVFRAFQIVACCASVARIPPRSSARGDEIEAQCAPPSVVRRRAPRRPTIQQILSEGAEPPSNSASTPLVCRDQEAPPSPENSIRPERPASHMTFEPGGEIKRGLENARAVSHPRLDLESTRLNSSHTVSSYAVFCLRKRNSEQTSGASVP